MRKDLVFKFLSVSALIVGCVDFTHGSLHSIQVPTEKIAMEQKVHYLIFVMQERLSLIEDVAKYKWNHQLPIEDLSREKLLLATQTNRVKNENLDRAWVQKFLQAQMDAAKIIIGRSVENWKKENITVFNDVPDLYSELRPELDRATKEMISIIEEVGGFIFDPAVRNMVKESRKAIPQDSALAEAWEKAIEPLLSF